jgi:RNA ligase (TIGR02306 family)
MMKSTHKAEVVPVVLLPHENSENLSIVKVFGYTVVVNTKQWEGIDKAVYVVPDSLVNTLKPEFSFLYKGNGFSSNPDDYIVRVKTIKLRGVVSMGLLIPAPADSNIGDDLAEFYGITRYEPEFQGSTGGDCVAAPPIYAPKYDVDSFHRYLDLFEEGEQVFISEKIHGASARFTYYEDQLYCGSRTQWKKENKSDLWWRAAYNTPQIEAFCKSNQGYVLYGEIFGPVQNLKYGQKDVNFAAFDILRATQYLDVPTFLGYCDIWKVPTVPIIEKQWTLDKSKVLEFAEGQSLIADHIREGCVIKPMKERWTEEVGRLALKIVGNGYYALK